ncbi:MAG TPA: carboxylesterase family protein [Lacisediminihabitans sp.]|uniref:carboxylesterase/lipase family protein n=1 Tax=Lacisediminihabitans sp. TaxID=2787631 RepID=UPI002EDA8881
MTAVTTEYGVLDGLETDGLYTFRNVPYAAPPFGERRFAKPRPPKPWDGVRDATQPGPAAPQPLSRPDAFGGAYTPTAVGEDCLTLEIRTPELGAAALPVMVHIHGGGLVSGAGSSPGYAGAAFARAGIVHVSINYRLGIEGFLYFEDGADNLGLRDQVAALEWVHRNIAVFGGDPSRVTIYGQSGGGVSTMSHLVIPASRGLFAQAISQSGCPVASIDAEEALTFTRQVARRLRIAPTRAAFATVPWQRTVALEPSLMTRFLLRFLGGKRDPLFISPFRIVHGTEFLPLSPLAASPSSSDVPLLAGTVHNETKDFVAALSAVPVLGSRLERGVLRALHVDGELRRSYSHGTRKIVSDGALAEAAWTDWAFRIPTIRLLETRDAPSWLYEFRWQPQHLPAGQGAVHAIELPFVHDDLDAILSAGGASRSVLGENPPREVAAAMHRAWTEFVISGEPGWDTYRRPERPTMVFDKMSGTVPDAAGAERHAWAGRR